MLLHMLLFFSPPLDFGLWSVFFQGT
jgi:hypothetical protein